MKDAFGRFISEGDIVLYSTRSGSCQYMNIAKVTRVEDKKVKVNVLAGTGCDWTYGTGKFVGNEYKKFPCEGYETTLHASGNVVISNGIDAGGIRERVLAEQKKHINKD
jgi:hypothetical protein